MPYTGFDPIEPGGPIDVSGGGLDPSRYYLYSPGGRFPGDVANYLDFLAGRSTPQGPNPDYKLPAWAEKLPGWLGRFARFHEWNVQNNGNGSVAEPVGGPAYSFFSGPGAQYGPTGGPLHGIADQGTDHFLDGIDYPATGGGDAGGGRQRGGGDGGYHGPSGLPSYGGLSFTPQFLDWQPIAPGTSAQTPTRFVPGAGSSIPGGQRAGPAPAQPAPQKPSRAGRTPGRGAGQQTPPTPRPGAGGGNGGGTGGTGDPFLDWLASMLEGGGSDAGVREPIGPSLRDGATGFDVGNLDRGTPGWLRDPTTGVYDTSGMPLPTFRVPTPGETEGAYMDYLHGLGFGNDDLMSLLGGRGFNRAGDGSWSWDWGTGPVVRGAHGYQFANQVGGGGTSSRHGSDSTSPSTIWGEILRR